MNQTSVRLKHISIFLPSYGPMNPVNFLGGIQTAYGSRAGQVKFNKEEDFRKFAERIRNFGVQVKIRITGILH